MASFLNSVRQGFSRPSNKSSTQQKNGVSPSQSPGPNQPGIVQPPPRPSASSTSIFSSTSIISNNEVAQSGDNNNNNSRVVNMGPPPLFLHPTQNFLVKGNYMTLAVQPKAVDLAEWIAHQVVEQYRTLRKFVDCIQGADPGKLPLCNQISCPTMSAGTHTYTWLDNNRQPTRLPAHKYIELVEKWITGKITDTVLFPTDPISPSVAANAATYASGGVQTPGSEVPIAFPPTNLSAPLSTLSGANGVSNRDWIGKANRFPESFFNECRNIYKQMFRVYAHLYWGHFEWPYYHLDLERSLNSSLMLFVIVGTELELLTMKDLEPLQQLFERWISLEKFPADCRFLTMASAAQQHSQQQTAVPSMNALVNSNAATSEMGTTNGGAGMGQAGVGIAVTSSPLSPTGASRGHGSGAGSGVGAGAGVGTGGASEQWPVSDR